MLTRHDHQAGREVVHPQVKGALGAALALDHAKNLQAVVTPGLHVGGFDAQVTQ